MIEHVIKIFKETQSIRAVSRETGYSWQRVVKILASNEIIINDTHRLILKLYNKGVSSEEIAKQIGCNIRTVNAYLPKKRPYYGINPSENAKRIKKHRDKNK